MRLDTITCLLPMHAQRFSVPPAQPPPRGGGEGRSAGADTVTKVSSLGPVPRKPALPAHLDSFLGCVERDTLPLQASAQHL